MIIEEFLNDGTLVKRCSDNGVLIQKVGTEEMYAEAIDLTSSSWEYVETDIPIPTENTEEEVGTIDVESDD